jgi:hypothetical protein
MTPFPAELVVAEALLPPPLAERRRRWWKQHVERHDLQPLALALLIEYVLDADNVDGTTCLGPSTLGRQLGKNRRSCMRSDGQLVEAGIITIDRDPDQEEFEGAYRVVRLVGYADIWIPSDRAERGRATLQSSSPSSSPSPSDSNINNPKEEGPTPPSVERTAAVATPPFSTPPSTPSAPRIAPDVVADQTRGEDELIPEQQEVLTELGAWCVKGAEDFCRLDHVTPDWLRAIVAEGKRKGVHHRGKMGGWIATAIREQWQVKPMRKPETPDEVRVRIAKEATEARQREEKIRQERQEIELQRLERQKLRT